MAKQLYDYWFVQFDFPDENGKPYKSSGGKMVWNEKLKREIPEGWNKATLLDIAIYTNGLACQKFRPVKGESRLPVIKIREMHNGISSDTEFVKEDIPESVKVHNGDVLFSWSASLEIQIWNNGEGGLNQHIFKVTSKNNYPRTFYYFQLVNYIHHFKKMAEARKTTMGHITQDHLRQSKIVVPKDFSLVIKLDKKLAPILKQVSLNCKEINRLTKLRDELLPLLMNGQASVNYDLSDQRIKNPYYLALSNTKSSRMKEEIIKGVLRKLHLFMDEAQINQTRTVLIEEMQDYEISPICEMHNEEKDQELISIFLSSKKIEGCSDKTISYYNSTIRHLLQAVPKAICMITTNDIRHYLSKRQEEKNLSKVTIDNIRRIFSSFFSWLEDEDYISKSPVRRIHKVRTDSLVKDTINDEDMETLRDSCSNMRDLAMIDLLASTGIRVGELVKINRSDIDFQERQCIVLGKGNKEREVYFNARTKIHLKSYLKHRTDNNPALFVSFNKPNTRLTIGGVEKRLSLLGRNANINKIHPHKFRRTLATKAIDKGMPIEQVQRLLGHVRIDTTLHYAMVNQTNVKMAHRKYIA